jgi:hypothetical protein
MSKLVEKYQNSCFTLKDIMEHNVTNQVDISGRISHYYSDKPYNIYYTDCHAFQNFVTTTNNNTDNNIFIKVNSPSCDFIKTEVDLKKQSVTYTLY